MRVKDLSVVWLCLIGFLPSASYAVSYTVTMDKSEWKAEGGPLECHLSQTIPEYGEAVFSSKSGEPLHFSIQAWNNLMRKGEAMLAARAPLWKPTLNDVNLGYVPVQQTATPIELSANLAMRLLEELQMGRSPVFTRKPWSGADESVEIGMSAVNFREAYGKYMNCLAQLLPVNFNQLAESIIPFGNDGWKLSDENRAKLDVIARYVKSDKTVSAIFIDGHTDSSGRPSNNRELSRERAEIVTRYLVLQGVKPEMITTRYHGERFPMVANDSAANREKNRRVGIRLKREDI